MQGIHSQDGQQALSGLANSKLIELKRGLNQASKPFNLKELTVEQIQEVKAHELERNEEAAEMFENYFATMLVKEMRSSLKTGFFEGPGSDAYGAWFDEHMGASLRKGDGLGIGKMVRDALNPNPARQASKFEETLGGFQKMQHSQKDELTR